MKRSFISTLLLGFVSLLFFSSCSKETPIPSEFTTKVVVEKFTGEWCGACASSGTFYDDNSDNPQFIGVGIHAGSQGNPDRYKDNEACSTMYSHLRTELREGGGNFSIGFPNVMLNRGTDGNNKIINAYNRATWQSRLDELSGQIANCGLSIESRISNGMLSGKIKYILNEELLNSPAITVYLLEHDLEGSEQVGKGPTYRHNFVLRGLMTNKNGNAIDGAMVKSIMEFEFDPINISDFKAADLEIVAFIHENGSDLELKKILNGQKVQVGLNQNFD